MALLVTTGCQRLNYTTTVQQLSPRQPHDINFSSPAYNQKVTITIEPTEAGVSAYLVNNDHVEKVNAMLKQGKEPEVSLVLGSHLSVGSAQKYSFEVSVPAKTPYTLLLKATGRATDVKVTVVGR
jgi:hypothetical protein